MYKNRNGNSKHRECSLHLASHTHTHTQTDTHTQARSVMTLTHTHLQIHLFLTLARFIWLRRLKWVQTHNFAFDSHFRKDSTCYKIIPACETTASRPSVRLSWRGQTGRRARQTVRRHSQCVCDSHCEGRAVPHSAVNRRKRKTVHTHLDRLVQCTQESAVKYQGCAHTQTHTQVAGSDEAQTHSHLDEAGDLTHRSGDGVLPVCGRA